MPDDEKLLVFGCEESYFFRSGQPFNAGEYGYLPSAFPPPCQVTQGVIRTALLSGHGVDFTDYNRDHFCRVCGRGADACAVLRAVGSSGSYHDIGMDLKGPCVSQVTGDTVRRLYPAPFDLVRLQMEEGEPVRYARLKPGSRPIATDLGTVYFPAHPSHYKSLTDHWLTEEGLLSYLQGREVADQDMYRSAGDAESDPKVFLAREQRIGIARDHTRRSAVEHMLYATEHVRFRSGFGLAVRIGGLPATALPHTVKLGGEGRLSSLTAFASAPISSAGICQAAKQQPEQTVGTCFKLVLLTPARFGNGWLPEGFAGTGQEEAAVWSGKLNGMDCTLLSTCLGRPLVIGGWDMARQRPKARRSYVAAGSVYYFITEEPMEEVVAVLHDKKIGLDSEIGCGHVVVGRW